MNYQQFCTLRKDYILSTHPKENPTPARWTAERASYAMNKNKELFKDFSKEQFYDIHFMLSKITECQYHEFKMMYDKIKHSAY